MTLSVVVLAGSQVFGASFLFSLFLVSAGVGGLLTWGISRLRIRQLRKMLGLAAVLPLVVAIPEIVTDVCRWCWWCWC